MIIDLKENSHLIDGKKITISLTLLPLYMVENLFTFLPKNKTQMESSVKKTEKRILKK
jgi:hypothetical protein